MNDAPAAEKSATNIGEITFGGPIFNVVSLNYLGKRHKKTFTKSLGGHGPCGPPGYAIEPGYAERLSISKLLAFTISLGSNNSQINLHLFVPNLVVV